METTVQQAKTKSKVTKPQYHYALGCKFCKFEMDFVDRAIRNVNRFMSRYGKGRAARDIGADVSFRRKHYVQGTINTDTDYGQKNDN